MKRSLPSILATRRVVRELHVATLKHTSIMHKNDVRRVQPGLIIVQMISIRAVERVYLRARKAINQPCTQFHISCHTHVYYPRFSLGLFVQATLAPMLSRTNVYCEGCTGET